MSEIVRKAGYVALMGRPNAGKSTLLNRLLAEKVAIVSDKPQTTRHCLVGILSDEKGQIVFFDTPGVHKPQHRLNRQMVRYASDALRDANVVCLLVDATQRSGPGDEYMLELLRGTECRRIVLLNKVDQVAKPKLLPRIASYAETGLFEEIVPISALNGDGCVLTLDLLWKMLPEGEPFYDEELLTVHSERFLVAERIREKVLQQTRDELPYSTAVVLEQWEDTEKLIRIHASILVEKNGQKKILVGRRGERIKSIGIAAREDLEQYLGRHIFLDLRVRLETGWRESSRILADIDRDLHSSR